MVTLDLKQEIIIRSLQGRSNRAIARELKIDRKTVNKYVKEYLEAKEEIATSESIEGERLRSLTEQMTQAPQYPKRNSPSRKWNEEMDECLDEILASEERKRALLGTSKQQLKKNQIFALMKEKGFDIGYTTVCQKINERQAKPKEAFIAQDYSYGCRFEYDFGEVILYIAGKRRKVFMAVMSAPASGYRFARLYFNQKQAVFIDSQIRFFTHMGGVFEYGVYDNMKNAVARFTGREKQLNPALVQFSLYYGFRVQTTNCYAGNEKGSVESAVKIVRQKAFASTWEFESLECAQQHLDQVLDKLNADTSVDLERACLKPLPPAYEFADIQAHSAVDKYSCVQIDHVRYSVPDMFVGKYVTVKLYPNDVIITYAGETIARHKRCFDKGQFVLDINHFITTFKRKPGALEHSRVLQAHATLKEVFDQHYKDNPREFVVILERCRDKTFDEVVVALKNRMVTPDVSTVYQDSDPIATQTLSQIALIGTSVRSVA